MRTRRTRTAEDKDVVGLHRHTTRRAAGYGTVRPQDARLIERGRVSKPAQFAIGVGMQAKFLALAGDIEYPATRS